MKSELVNIITQIIYLLNECNWQNKALWFADKLDKINRYHEGTEEFISLTKDIQKIIAGMGSFTDLPLMPREESLLSYDYVRSMQFELAVRLDTVILKLLKERSNA